MARIVRESTSPREKRFHFPNDVILPVDEAVMVGIGEDENVAVRNCFAKGLDLVLFELAARFQKIVHRVASLISQVFKLFGDVGTGIDHGNEQGR